jgi:hypothetical protein
MMETATGRQAKVHQVKAMALYHCTNSAAYPAKSTKEEGQKMRGKKYDL